MISIYDLFENGELILQETLINSIFKYVDYFLLDGLLDNEQLLEFQYTVNDRFEVDLRYYTKLNYGVITGEYIKPNIIVIYLPSKQEDLLKCTSTDLINVFLHEFSHMITDKKIPKLVTVNGQPFKTKLIPPPFEDINFEDNKEKIKPLLDYIYQLREMPNFAFSIGFDLINYTKFTTEEIYQKNRAIIKQNNRLERNIYYYNLSINLKTFFELQYFTNKVYRSNYARKFIKMRKMIEKYRRRLKIYTRKS